MQRAGPGEKTVVPECAPQRAKRAVEDADDAGDKVARDARGARASRAAFSPALSALSAARFARRCAHTGTTVFSPGPASTASCGLSSLHVTPGLRSRPINNTSAPK